MIPGLEVIKLELILRLKIKRNDWLLADTSFVALDGVTSFLRLKDVTNTCKRMRRGLSIGGSSSVQRRKFGRS